MVCGSGWIGGAVAQFPPAADEGVFPGRRRTPNCAKLAEDTSGRIRAALEDDLNTAQAQAAIFRNGARCERGNGRRHMRKNNTVAVSDGSRAVRRDFRRAPGR